MNLKSFFEKFDQFADAPNAVAKMRELVLQLAMQGKLVEQRDADGTAAQLLSAISCERVTRVRSLRTPENQQPTNGDAHLFEIPSNWAWTKLGNVALQIQYGYTASADQSLTEIRMLRITDIQNNRVDWSSVPGCQIEQKEAEKYLLILNDILIARTGGTIGKSFIVPETPVKSVFASYLIRVTPPQSIAAQYLKLFLESPLYWTQLRTMSAGTGQPNVNGQALGRLEFPLPPLAEQKRIVAKVDELMALCDRLETQQQERDTWHAALARASLARFADAPIPANLNLLFQPSYAIAPADLRRSILTLAVEGNLVQSAGTTRFDWKSETVGTVCLQITDGEHATPQRTTQGVPLATAKNIRDGYLDMRSTDWVAKETAEKCWKRCKPRHEDLLMVCVGATTGRICRAQHPPDMVLVRSVALIRPNPEIVLPIYMDLFLRSPTGQSQIWANVKQSAQPCLYLGKMSEIQISFPPLTEQRRIVAKVDQLMALVVQLETQLTGSRTASVNLMEAMVAELTAQK